MPAPYSDNLYSALDDSDDEQHDALSPADGYFHASSSSDAASSSQAPPQHYPSYPNVPSVPNVLVEDPTLREQDASAKAREADEERTLNSTIRSTQQGSSPATAQPRSPSHLPSHHHRRSVEDDHQSSSSSSSAAAPQLDTRPPFHPIPSDAPPAYSPRSPTSPTSPPSNTGTGYQTFPPSTSTAPRATTMGVPEEQQRLLPREPESMGHAPRGQRGGLWWQRFKDQWSSGDGRKKIRTVLGVLLLLSILVVILSGSFVEPSHGKNGGNGGNGDNGGNHDNPPELKDPDPIKEPDLSHGDLKWDPRQGCYNNPHSFAKLSSRIDFNPSKNLNILEKIDDHEPHSGREPHVSGTLVLRPSGDDSSGRVDLEVISNDKDLTVKADWDTDNQFFKVITPRGVDWDSSSLRPCIQIRITVWVPSEASLHRFEADITHLDIDVISGMDLSLADKAFFTSVVGDISTPKPSNDVLPYKLASREIRLQTVSGDVTGWYPLYDLLSISTASGDVSADVAPKAVDDARPKSAVLNVASISGDLNLKEPLDVALKSSKAESSIPARDYIVKMETTSGHIRADLAVSSSAKFSTQSGDFNLRLWPVLDSGLEPSITTDTKSGDTNLYLLEPRWIKMQGLEGREGLEVPSDNGDSDAKGEDSDGPYLIIHPHNERSYSTDSYGKAALSSLRSKHTSISGTMLLRYPASWTGSLEGQTVSASQKFRGKGLTTIKSRFPPTIKGSKGSGNSYLEVNTISGDQDFLVGEE